MFDLKFLKLLVNCITLKKTYTYTYFFKKTAYMYHKSLF